MKIHAVVSMTILAVTSVAASAQGLYVLGEITRSNTSLNGRTFDSSLAQNGALGLSSHDSGNNNKWRLQGGYEINPYLAVEGGFIDFGTAKYQGTYTGGNARGKLKATGFDSAALFKLPLNTKLSAFGKVGLVVAKVKSSLVADGPASLASGRDSSTVVRPLLGLGADYKLTEKISLRLDYDHVGGLGNSSHTGKMDVNMVSMGATYHF